MKKFFGNWNPRRSSSGPSTSQRESFPDPDAVVPRSFRKLKSQLQCYKASGTIHKAASRGAVVIIRSKFLLGKNRADDRDTDDRTMLHYACAHGHSVVVSFLIEWNCDIHLRDSDNCTALIKASQYGHERCALILLNHGADPNAKDNYGNTALHYAVWNNKTSMANMLLEHHADITIKNKDNYTPYTLAQLRNNESLAKFLVDKRDQILKADELKRLKCDNPKIKVKPEPPREDSEQPQVNLDGTSLVSEEADKQKVISLQSTEKLNDSWLHSSEDQNQRVVHASENGNHSAIHVSENLNPSLACTSVNESQTEVPESLMNSVVHEAEKPNHSAAALVLQKQHGKTEEQPVPVEENLQDDGVKNNFEMRQKNSNEQENGKFTCTENLNTNQSETDEINILSHKIDLTKKSLSQVSFNCERLKNKNQSLHQKILANTLVQEKCKMLEEREEKLKQELLILETHMQKTMIDHREAEILLQETEERSRLQVEEELERIPLILQTHFEDREQSQQRKENYLHLKISELKCRIKDMKSKLCRAEAHENFVRLKLGVYQECYHEDRKVTASLSEQIKNAPKLQKDRARLIAKKELLTHPHTRAVHIPEETGIPYLHHHVGFSGNLTPSLGTSRLQHRVLVNYWLFFIQLMCMKDL